MNALFAKYFSVITGSMIKFIWGPLAGLAWGFSWIETVICSVAGMMASVLSVSIIGKQLQPLLDSFQKKPIKRFTKTTRFAVRMWQRFGLLGIAGLTPILFTPIGGTIIALSFRVSVPKIWLYMLLAAIFWGIILATLFYNIKDAARYFMQ